MRWRAVSNNNKPQKELSILAKDKQLQSGGYPLTLGANE